MAHLLQNALAMIIAAFLLAGLVDGGVIAPEQPTILSSGAAPTDIIYQPYSTAAITVMAGHSSLATLGSASSVSTGASSDDMAALDLPTALLPDADLPEAPKNARPSVLAPYFATTIPTPIGEALEKRTPCTQAGIVFDCGTTATSMPAAPFFQGCGKSSNSIGSNPTDIKAAAYTFCDLYFPTNSPRTFQSGAKGYAATIGISDGNLISFEARWDWLAVSTSAGFSMTRDSCYANFVAAVNLCTSDDKPLLSGGQFDTALGGVPAHFIVAVFPDTDTETKK